MPSLWSDGLKEVTMAQIFLRNKSHVVSLVGNAVDKGQSKYTERSKTFWPVIPVVSSCLSPETEAGHSGDFCHPDP